MKGEVRSVLVFSVMFILVGSGFGIAAGSVEREEPMEIVEEKDIDGLEGEEIKDLADSPWPSFGRDRKNTGQSPYDTSHVDGAEKWRFATGDAVESSPAIREDGTIYIGSGSIGTRGSYEEGLFAVDSDGKEEWMFETNDAVESSPAIGDAGTVYMGSHDGNLYAVDQDNGTEKWNYTTPGRISSSPAIGDDGTVYVGSHDGNLSAISSDGTEEWNFETDDSVSSSPAIGDDGTIFVGSHDNNIYAINPEGSEEWRFETSDAVRSSPAIGDDGNIYVGSHDNNIYAISSDGAEEWSLETGGPVSASPAIGDDGTIYVGSHDNNTYAINPEGSEEWRFETSDAVRSSPGIGEDGTIYVGSSDNNLYAVNPDGTERWSFETGNEVLSSPAVGSDGTIYFASLDQNLYALGEADFYLTIEEPVGNGTVEVEGREVTEWPYQQGYIAGDEIDLTAVSDEGWGFKEWTGDYTGTEEDITITMDEDKTLTPHFEDLDEYELEIEINGEGSTIPEEGSHTYYEGTEVILEATPDEGWYFANWAGDVYDTQKEITVTMDEDKQITAHFDEVALDEKVLTLDVQGEGTTQPEPGQHTYEEGTEVILEATADEGWYFDGWSGDYIGADKEATISMDENKSITAHFEEEIIEHTLSINIEGEGSTEPVEGSHTYEEGTVVMVEAAPAEGWTFVEWTGDYTGEEEEITITMDEDKEITAVFEEIEYDLTIGAEEGGTTDPGPGLHIYPYGEEVTVEALPYEGWQFAEWTGDVEGIEEEITITMDEDKEITAVFEEIEYDLTIGAEEGGTTDPEPGIHTFEKGEEVTVTAISDADRIFTHWTGDVESEEEQILTRAK